MQAGAITWVRPVNRVERTDNGWRIRADIMFLELPYRTWFRFPTDTYVTIPTIFRDLRRGTDREHSLDWGRFELPAEFEIPLGYVILKPTMQPYRIIEGTVRMPCNRSCRITPRAEMRYRIEDPDDPTVCSFWIDGDLREMFPDGTFIYVDYPPASIVAYLRSLNRYFAMYRRVREGNGYRVDLEGMYLKPPTFAWFKFPRGTIFDLPPLEEDYVLYERYELVHGAFYLPLEFDLISDLSIHRADARRTRLRGTVTMPPGHRFLMIPENKVWYYVERPYTGEDFSVAFITYEGMEFRFPAGSSIYVANRR
ncbi:hypothetical protein R1sor_009884 [Riccia sorocarpa]|uniref:Uncharacterized protein n=1 Tax=Riccia sorocarpa TaxID=122646 RepID=A0ABD3HWC4_9MARC